MLASWHATTVLLART